MRILTGLMAGSVNSTAQHSTAQHSTAQHSTAQHSTAQHSTAQHSTAQHSTAQHSTAAGHSRAGIASLPPILMISKANLMVGWAPTASRAQSTPLPSVPSLITFRAFLWSAPLIGTAPNSLARSSRSCTVSKAKTCKHASGYQCTEYPSRQTSYKA